MLDSNMPFLPDGVYDEMCPTNSLKDEHWEKVQNLLPTPPCSPEDLCYQAFPELPAPASFQEGLQVVPMKAIQDSEIEPLPVLELSDEEMQKLTSPTVFDGSMWLQSRPNPPPAPTLQSRDQFESKNVSGVNYISHGIRTVHISDSVIETPSFGQSFVLTVNANPIQPLNTVGHLTTREVFMSQNATTWSLNSGMLDFVLLTERLFQILVCVPLFLSESEREWGRQRKRASVWERGGERERGREREGERERERGREREGWRGGIMNRKMEVEIEKERGRQKGFVRRRAYEVQCGLIEEASCFLLNNLLIARYRFCWTSVRLHCTLDSDKVWLSRRSKIYSIMFRYLWDQVMNIIFPVRDMRIW